MLLSQFIREEIDAILDEWEVFASQIPTAKGMASGDLRDHARGILLTIANDLDTPQSAEQQSAKARGLGPPCELETEAEMHGLARVAAGFTVNDAMAEFRALRASVLRLWSASESAAGEPSELTRFHEGIDQALTESLASYSEQKDRQARLLAALLAASPDLHYVVDRHDKIIYCNKAVADLFGKRTEQLLGAEFSRLCIPYSPGIVQQVRDAARDCAGARSDLRVRVAGEDLVFEQVLVPVRDPGGRCEAVAATARDVTKRKASEERARRSANFDLLTGLPNRGLFRERLEHEIKHAARIGLPLALLFIDLDGFKEVNDRHGHIAGDELLQQVARRLQACVRDTDTVARLGGDEFTVILTDVTVPPFVETLSGEILAELRKPFALANVEAAISGSIGISLYPNDGARPEELVRNADRAMYDAKQGGRNRYAFFSSASMVRPSGSAARASAHRAGS
jgi:diguanylate cyclase (GGDEF)-like protein/PAS domain S-box-containing protein